MTSRDTLDSSYEEDLNRNPYNLKNWIYYLEFKSEAIPAVRYSIYDRAVTHLPRSYKLWHQYLTERVKDCEKHVITSSLYEEVNSVFEKALIHMHKMPVIWNMYLAFLTPQHLITRTRHTFDRALRSLPITQHAKWVWPLYISFADNCGVPETCARVWRRYVKLCPGDREAHVKALLKADAYDAAAEQLAAIINDEAFVSVEGRSRFELWVDLLKLLVRHGEQVHSLDAEAVIRTGIQRYPHEAARMWNALADMYIRRGLLERARDVYEEALQEVVTVRDATAVYEAYAKFEYGLVEATAARLDELEDEVAARKNNDGKSQNPDLSHLSESALLSLLEEATVSSDMRMDRLEALTQRRPWLINDVLLRQHPHLVGEWQVRVGLCGDDVVRVLQTYAQATRTIDPAKAVGRLDRLWVSFADVYARAGQYADARGVYERAVAVVYPKAEHAAQVWCRYAEMELLAGEGERALLVLTRATSGSSQSGSAADGALNRVHQNVKVWALLADVTESVRGARAASAVYERALQLKISTPQLVLTHVQLLEELKDYSAAFRVLERAVTLFGYPAAAPVWLSYCRKFIERYGSRKVERARDLLEHAVAAAPAEYARPLFLLYARFEERHGMPRAMMRVLDRAVAQLPVGERLDMYYVYLAKASEYFGAAKTRPIYDAALQALPDAQVGVLALRYAAMERRLGDLDRARGIYQYAAQTTDPKTNPTFWNVYHKFECVHGSEDTFKDMLRLRRTVRAQYEQANVNTITSVSKVNVNKQSGGGAEDDMAAFNAAVKRKHAESAE